MMDYSIFLLIFAASCGLLYQVILVHFLTVVCQSVVYISFSLWSLYLNVSDSLIYSPKTSTLSLDGRLHFQEQPENWTELSYMNISDIFFVHWPYFAAAF